MVGFHPIMSPCLVVELWGHGKPVGTWSIGAAEGLLHVGSAIVPAAATTPQSNTEAVGAQIADTRKDDTLFTAAIIALQLVTTNINEMLLLLF